MVQSSLRNRAARGDRFGRKGAWEEVRGRYRADTILRILMLAVSAVLGLAWFCKALTMKDSLLSTVTGRADPASGSWQISDDAREQIAGWLAAYLRGQYPAGRLKENAEADGAESGGPLRTAAFYAAEYIYGRSPVCRFWMKEMEVPDGMTEDPDPSYDSYLKRQKVTQEAWYLLFRGGSDAGDGQSESPAGGFFAGERSESPAGGQLGFFAGGQIGETAGLSGSLSGQELPLRQMSWRTPAYHRRDGLAVTGTAYVLEQLLDYDFLMQNFYSVHASTTAGRDEMDAAGLLGRDLSIEKDASVPQILIYHTHSQETFADYGPGNPDATVVHIGSRLAELLEEKGYRVLHDTTAYDIMDGELDRNHAYNYALDGITSILQQYPSIQVVLDIHRDGVGENVRLVSEIDGRPTAQIMFFNGMSQTPEGPIEYLPNPYKEDNLAFSLQMQLDAAAYYPGLTRKIYLKGLRYNLHVRPRSALIEVGAQTNTCEEALNAMEPLAELLDMTLGG